MSYTDKNRPFLLIMAAFDRLSFGCAYVSTWMMFTVALMIAYEVVVRYFFSSPTKWVNDFTDYAMLYTTFFSSAWLLKNGDHIRLTTLLDHLSPKSRRVVETIDSFIGAALCLYMVWYGAAETWDAFRNNIALPRALAMPKYCVIVVIPFGFFMLAVQFLRDAVTLLSGPDSASEQG